jgi:hypothetical protein
MLTKHFRSELFDDSDFTKQLISTNNYNMTSFKRFESKPVNALWLLLLLISFFVSKSLQSIEISLYLAFTNELNVANKIILMKDWFYLEILFCWGKVHFRSELFDDSDFTKQLISTNNYNMTSFKRFESKPVVKIIYIYTHCNLYHVRGEIHCLRNNSWKPYVYIVFTTGRP